ncbi:MAG: tetratricopeptide repeat protein [Saprospiraceae bacterium]|nr:tetratricopeptide repeat protein [Saprospiraceae bacterium]
MRFFILLFVGLILLGSACRQPDLSVQIANLEMAQQQTHSPERADSLLLLYHATVEKHPDLSEQNLRFLTKAAEIKFFRQKDNVTAVRWLNDAIARHGKGQDVSEPIGLLARIWLAYKYRATFDLTGKPDDIDLMRANLMRNMRWIDSCLVRLEREMGTPPALDATKAAAYIEVAEGYAILLESGSPAKHGDLMFSAAQVAHAIGEANKAVQLYYKVGEGLPWHPKAPHSLLEMGRLYENDNDTERAKSAYGTILRYYPQHPDVADDAQAALKRLGTTK